MIQLAVEQGSPEWITLRLGIPTASKFDQILTPKTRKVSASSHKYLCELLAERAFGHPVHEVSTALMERGVELEASAASLYELQHGCDTERVGFVFHDRARRFGCSPDRFVGTDGLLEIKCPSASVHISALLGNEDDSYFSQVQGQMWVTGRRWCDLYYYNPALPSRVVRIERDEDYIGALEQAVTAFCDRLDQAEAALRDEYGDAMFATPAGLRLVGRGDDDDPEPGAPAAHITPGTDAGADVSVTKPLSDVERERARRGLTTRK